MCFSSWNLQLYTCTGLYLNYLLYVHVSCLQKGMFSKQEKHGVSSVTTPIKAWKIHLKSKQISHCLFKKQKRHQHWYQLISCTLTANTSSINSTAYCVINSKQNKNTPNMCSFLKYTLFCLSVFRDSWFLTPAELTVWFYNTMNINWKVNIWLIFCLLFYVYSVWALFWRPTLVGCLPPNLFF